MSSSTDDFDMEAHAASMKRHTNKVEWDKKYREAHSDDIREEIRATYIRRAKDARAVHKLQRGSPKPPFLHRLRYWLGHVVPRRHWGIYVADGRRRLVTWKSWLGKATKEIDVRIG